MISGEGGTGYFQAVGQGLEQGVVVAEIALRVGGTPLVFSIGATRSTSGVAETERQEDRQTLKDRRGKPDGEVDDQPRDKLPGKGVIPGGHHLLQVVVQNVVAVNPFRDHLDLGGESAVASFFRRR